MAHAIHNRIINISTKYPFICSFCKLQLLIIGVMMFPIVLLYLIRFCGCQTPDVSYVVNMDSQMECCDDESQGFVDVSEVSVARYNETVSYMTGKIRFLQDVGDDTMVEVMLQKEASGKYELVFIHEINDLCEEVTKGDDSDYYTYIKYFGIPDKCPFAAGEYPIKEFVMDTNEMPLNSKTAGRYQALLNLYKKPETGSATLREFMCCLIIKLIVEME